MKAPTWEKLCFLLLFSSQFCAAENSTQHSQYSEKLSSFLLLTPLATYTVDNLYLFDSSDYGTVFYNDDAPFLFKGTSPSASLSFHNLSLSGAGPAIFSSKELCFNKLSLLSVKQNSSLGGAIYAQNSVSFIDNDKLSFENNSCIGNGAALSIEGPTKNTLIIEKTKGSIVFQNNRAEKSGSEQTEYIREGHGGAISILSPNSSLIFRDNSAAINVKNNFTIWHGGAFFNKTGLTQLINNVSNITFADNVTLTNGGAIYSRIASIENNKKRIDFCII